MRDDKNTTRLLLERELNSAVRSTVCKSLLRHHVTRFPGFLRECQAPPLALKPYNKIFAATWLCENTIAVATKCNHLLLVDVHKYAVQAVALPPAPPRPAGAPLNPHGGCGIHAVAVNPSGTLLASGGRNAEDCAVLKLPSCEALQALVGHTDWLFGITWLTDVHLATGSRDKNIKLWKVWNEQETKSDPCLMTISSNQVRLLCCKDPVCLAMQGNMVAAGTARAAELLDVRTPRQTGFLLSLDPEGIRSISFNQHVLTCGGASGTLVFYDVRNKAVLNVAQGADCALSDAEVAGGFTAPPASAGLQEGVTGLALDDLVLNLGTGYIEQNAVYREYLHRSSLKPACYAHCWDQYGTRLFAAGGPAMFGFRGCYMAMWQ